jgi:hygromycin-B 7''-O-kinase
MSVEVDLDSALAERLLRVAGITGHVEAVTPLGGGMGSAVFAVRVSDAEVVVKIYAEVARASMRKEMWVCDFLARRAPSLPIPKVLAVDESGLLVPQAFSVLSRLRGVYLRAELERLTDHDLVGVYRQIGTALQSLHEVVLPMFGEVMPGRGRRYKTNLEFMRAKFQDALRTFEELGGARHFHQRLKTYFQRAGRARQPTRRVLLSQRRTRREHAGRAIKERMAPDGCLGLRTCIGR